MNVARSPGRIQPRSRLARCLAFAAIVAAAVSAGCGPLDHLRARLQLKSGNQCYLRREYTQAIQRYDAALRLVPGLPAAHLNRAYAHEALFRGSVDPAERRRLADEAIHSFQAYLAARATHPDGKPPEPGRDRIEQHIVTLYIDSKQLDAALQFLTARLEQNPRDGATMQMLAMIDNESGRPDAALGWYRKRVAADPNSPEARHALGAFVWQMSYRNPMLDTAKRTALLDEGLAALQEAVAQWPDYFDALIYVNLLYREKAKYAERESDRVAYVAQAKIWYERANALRKPGAGAAGGADSAAAHSGIDGGGRPPGN